MLCIMGRRYLRGNELTMEKFLKVKSIRKELWSPTERVNLTPVETKLMQTFAKRPNSVFSRDELVQSIASSAPTKTKEKTNIRTIDVLIKRLRQKLEKNPKYPGYLKTIRGYGYMLEPD